MIAWDKLSETSNLLKKRETLRTESKKIDTSAKRKAVIEKYLEAIERDIDRLSYLRAEIKDEKEDKAKETP
jgi:hypothetical protein